MKLPGNHGTRSDTFHKQQKDTVFKLKFSKCSYRLTLTSLYFAPLYTNWDICACLCHTKRDSMKPVVCKHGQHVDGNIWKSTIVSV